MILTTQPDRNSNFAFYAYDLPIYIHKNDQMDDQFFITNYTCTHFKKSP